MGLKRDSLADRFLPEYPHLAAASRVAFSLSPFSFPSGSHRRWKTLSRAACAETRPPSYDFGLVHGLVGSDARSHEL